MAEKIKRARKLVFKENAIRNYWADTDPDLSAPVLHEMDNKDTWTVVNHAGVQNVLSQLADNLRLVHEISDDEWNRYANDLLFILAYIPTSWVVRLLKWLEENRNTVFARLIYTAKIQSNNDEEYLFCSPARLMMDRLLVIRNMSLTAAIFDASRSSFINHYVTAYEKTLYD